MKYLEGLEEAGYRFDVAAKAFNERKPGADNTKINDDYVKAAKAYGKLYWEVLPKNVHLTH